MNGSKQGIYSDKMIDAMGRAEKSLEYLRILFVEPAWPQARVYSIF
jgi:hypothetical protein